jgi:hypothetical protein
VYVNLVLSSDNFSNACARDQNVVVVVVVVIVSHSPNASIRFHDARTRAVFRNIHRVCIERVASRLVSNPNLKATRARARSKPRTRRASLARSLARTCVAIVLKLPL